MQDVYITAYLLPCGGCGLWNGQGGNRESEKEMNFNLKTEWFNKIKYGDKRHEYREFKPYWNKRINKLKKGDIIVFCKGYPQYMDSENMCAGIIKDINLLENGTNTDLKTNKPVWDIHFELSKNDVR